MQPVTVIGIDPGSQRTGWGVVREASGVLQLVDCGIIRTASAGKDFSARLARIYHELAAVLARLTPDEAAVEQVFTAKNAASALKLGQARGAAIAALAARGLPISDYEPTVVKKTLVGTGRAEKEQVAFMVQRLLNVKQQNWALDTSDALGIAVCHLTMRRFSALATASQPPCAPLPRRKKGPQSPF
ncbi:crossover junction endodeoxyribonuclease RuvC [uncultured Desulfovibrio sp.]|uniref:crossover junction endodeoxyribonuclease RuvC n=1 Tax=uncultured Desulfovibrio sp. TaxID=167968 RepID=UPI00262E1FB9|nr:crossover junction endodeoxyribonuclease RuvC [uncultured Desulfovibrio sp.]